jgi:uncharacterized membrane protein
MGNAHDSYTENNQIDVMQGNIRSTIEMHRRTIGSQSVQERLADLVTKFSGSMAFVYLHVIWFSVWILINTGILRVSGFEVFDPFPFSLLTLIVSLEAIVLSSLVLISQNQLSKVADRRAELDLQINLLAEQRTAKILEMLDHIRDQFNEMENSFHVPADPGVQVLKSSPDPKEVMEEIDKTINQTAEHIKDETKKGAEEVMDRVSSLKKPDSR